jgi:glycosyltransferase 2 family protein
MYNWLRLAITILLCALLLIYAVDVHVVLDTLARFEPLWAVAACAAFTLDRVLMSYKWGLLLELRGYRIPLAQRLMVYCSAMMWGLALPSTVGADGIRIVLVRRLGVRVDDALATILVERGIGFISALLMAVMGLVILRELLPANAAYDQAALICIACLLAGTAIVLFSFSRRALTSVVQVLPERLAMSRFVRLLERLHEAYRSLARDRRRLALFSVLTFTEQVLLVACYGVVALALEVQFNGWFMLAAVPLAILVSRLPISLDGIGIYEGIFMGVMSLGGVRPEDSLAVSIAARALQIVVWLPWWMFLTARTGAVRPADALATRAKAAATPLLPRPPAAGERAPRSVR